MRSVISGSIYLYILLVFISGFEKKSNVVATAPSSSSSFGNRLRYNLVSTVFTISNHTSPLLLT